MRFFATRSHLVRSTVLAVAGAVLAACAGAGSPPSLLPQAAERTSPISSSSVPAGIYITDLSSKAVVVLNKRTYKQIERITNGIHVPDGEWIDAKGNLYVADYGGKAIEEYGPGKTSPKMIYNAGMKDPIRVRTDAQDNVYEIDWSNYNMVPGYVNVYAQGSNKVKKTYEIDAGAADIGDVVFDKAGNMYADAVNPNVGVGIVVKFPHGSTKGTQLPVVTGWPSSMVMDTHGNLLIGIFAGTYISAGIDVVPPPYSKIASQITGFSSPYSFALNASASRLYVVDRGVNSVNPVVDVVAYPSGKLIKKLGPSDGITSPYGIAVAPELQ